MYCAAEAPAPGNTPATTDEPVEGAAKKLPATAASIDAAAKDAVVDTELPSAIDGMIEEADKAAGDSEVATAEEETTAVTKTVAAAKAEEQAAASSRGAGSRGFHEID